MKSIIPSIIGLLLIYIIYGLFLSQYDLSIFPKELRPENPSGFYDYRGVFNVHSLLSTGGSSPKEIIEAAKNSDVDFLIFTDLNQQFPLEDVEGYDGKVLVFTGGEYSYINSRLLTPEIPTQFDFKGAGQSQVYFADILSHEEKNGTDPFLILAHPFKPKYHWTGDYPKGLDGIEVINLKSVWQKAWLENRASFFWTLFTIPFNERLALIRLFDSPDQEIELWDKLSQSRHTVGLLGADAESKLRLTNNWRIPFPTYESLFSIGSNHILLKSELTGNAKADREKVLSALKQGQFYMSMDLLANPRGFNAFIRAKDGKTFMMGSEIELQEDMDLIVELPNKPDAPFDLDIFRNGEKIMTSNSQNTRLTLQEPGVYRVRVRVIPTFPIPDGKKWVTWILTNPFYVRENLKLK